MLDTLKKTSQGNPGCLLMLIEIIEHHQNAFFDVVDILTEHDIRGSRAYMLWNDICERDTSKLISYVYMIRDGSLSMDVVNAHLSGGRGRPFTDDELQ